MANEFIARNGLIAQQNSTVTGSLLVSSSNATQLLVGNNLVFVSSSGNVGLGTTSPLYKLDVNGTINISNSFGSRGVEGAYRLKFYDNGGTANDSGIGLDGSAGAEEMWFNSLGGFQWYLGTNGEKMRIDSTGNVGIGTTTPNAKLDVNGNVIITGSLTVTNGITGSLFGTASYALNAPAPRYEIFSWKSTGGNLINRPSDFNPQDQNQGNEVVGIIQYLYIDILDFTNQKNYHDLRFATFTDLTDYITSLTTADYKVIFYSYKNDTSNLRISGANTFMKGLHIKGAERHITSKGKIIADTSKPAFVALQYYLQFQLIADISPSIPNFTTNYINQSQLDTILADYTGDTSGTLRITPINKFKKRDFSRYYIGSWDNTINSSGTKIGTSNTHQAKILGTVLCAWNYSYSPKIVTKQFTTNYGYETQSKGKYNGDGYESYFHIYIIETSNGGRVLAVEGISTDIVTIPSAYTKVNTNGNPLTNSILMYRQGNKLDFHTSTKVDNAGVPQVSYLVPYVNTLNPSPYKVDAITLYLDGTCDVFPNALNPEIIKYNTSKLLHWKLNADYQKV